MERWVEMVESKKQLPVGNINQSLKWLMFSRVLFSTLLLGSTIILQLSKNVSPFAMPLLILYGLISGIFFLSFIYSLLLIRFKQDIVHAYIQISIDTLIVTFIIFVTGSFSSIFSFLYLVVIIYSSMLLFRKGSIYMAALCGIQYGIIVCLEYYGVIQPFVLEGSPTAIDYPWSHVSYKIIIIFLACFAVAFLSNLLSEQARKTKTELAAMEDHVKRVEKMAVIGEMGAGLAHEIKNPLASITGAIQLLEKNAPHDSDQEKLMQIILREADRLSTLVSNFLLFARPPTGKIVPIELNSALSETIALFEKDIIYSNRITISKDLTPDLWSEMDPIHLRQILWNLLLNAAEAIDREGNIDIQSFRIANNMIAIRISDDGCGIQKETLRSIFSPFFTTKKNGTGLGLSIVHRILESYGSRLDVESRVGEGAAFTLRIRRIDPAT